MSDRFSSSPSLHARSESAWVRSYNIPDDIRGFDLIANLRNSPIVMFNINTNTICIFIGPNDAEHLAAHVRACPRSKSDFGFWRERQLSCLLPVPCLPVLALWPERQPSPGQGACPSPFSSNTRLPPFLNSRCTEPFSPLPNFRRKVIIASGHRLRFACCISGSFLLSGLIDT